MNYPTKTYRWSREGYSQVLRFIDIWAFVLRWISSLWINRQSWSYVGGISDDKTKYRRRVQAIWVRETLLDLGPTFIKLGQLFSTRADLFPSEYVEELAKLQDKVPAFSYDQVQSIVNQDFGKSIPELFAYFESVPLAAASLGQVHRAKLYGGEEVVVKVQRLGLKKLFEIDLTILKGITRYFQHHPYWGKGRDWIGIYEECCRILWEEIDYLNEGRNADTFRRNFRQVDWALIPRVYWRYSSPRVLTLEYLPGIKISHYEAIEAAGLNRGELARLGAQAYLQQLLNDGFFHADPHPGNIAASADGRLIFYDFGMMGRLRSDIREKLLETFFGIAQKDAERVINSLVDLGALVPGEDRGPVRRSIQYMLDNFMDKPFEAQSIDAISDDLYEVAYNQPFRFPATFTFVMRAFSTLEGVGKGLDPTFNFMEVAKPFAMEIMNNGSQSTANGLFNELGRQAAEVSNRAFNLPRRVEETLDKLEQGDIRIRTRSIETERLLRRVSSAQLGTNYAILMGSFLLSATFLWVNGQAGLAIPLLILVLIVGGIFLRLMIRLDQSDR